MKKNLVLCIVCCILILTFGCEANNGKIKTSLEDTSSYVSEEYVKNSELPFQLEEFSFDNVQDYVYEDSYDLSFLTEDLQNKFYQAKFLAYEFDSGYSRIYLINNNNSPTPIKIKTQNISDKNPEEYISYICYNIDYTSFNNALLTLFTKEYLNNIEKNNHFINYNGKLACISGDRGYDITFRKIEFELISQDKDRIEFKGTAYYTSGDITSDIDYSKDYKFIILKTENGWRFSTFPIWY